MGVGEHVVNLVEHERDIRDVGDFDVQHVDVFIDAEKRLQGGERNEDRGILGAITAAGAERVLIFAQHAHHGERLAIDGDRAVERIDAAGKELVDNAGPEHDDLSLEFVVELGDGAAHGDIEAVHDERGRQDAADIESGGAALIGKATAARDRDFGGDALG